MIVGRPSGKVVLDSEKMCEIIEGNQEGLTGKKALKAVNRCAA